MKCGRDFLVSSRNEIIYFTFKWNKWETQDFTVNWLLERRLFEVVESGNCVG